ncbi:MAG: phosphotransferase family protein [Caldilineaceae bacterium]|nr:phosphotransferase family protein [Caldilineaceae bacterium]
MIDQPTHVRTGEELDLQRLEVYLAAHLPNSQGPLVIGQFPSGYSNLTYLLRMGSQELVLRRPPFGANIKSAHDMGREYKVLAGLRRVYAKVPQPLLYCEDESVIGAPFYVMARVRGLILRANPPADLTLSATLMQQLSYQAIDTLAEIHALDVAAAGLADLGRPEGYTARQISGWTRRYRAAQTDDVASLEAIIPWLEQHLPDDRGATLIHNDYKYDNLILDPTDLTRVIAVLDWEMCTLGDPLMDLGTTLGYWIEANDPPSLQAMFGLTALPGNLNRQALLERYRETSGRAVPQPLFYYVYGLFKIAVIIQQIYARYRQGLTHDARFAGLDQVVRDCGRLATLALEKERISGLL